MCKIAILENYTLFSSGIKSILKQEEGFEIIAEAKEINNLLPLIQGVRPDVIIIDVIHSENAGIVPLKKIKRKASKVPVLLIINKDYSNLLEQYISLGVNGFIFSDANGEELIWALKKLKDSEDYYPQKVWMLLKEFLRKRKPVVDSKENKSILTSREISVLRLFCKGLTYKEIGTTLNISPRTVETHKKNISTKINVRSTVEMVEYAMQNNLH